MNSPWELTASWSGSPESPKGQWGCKVRNQLTRKQGPFIDEYLVDRNVPSATLNPERAAICRKGELEPSGLRPRQVGHPSLLFPSLRAVRPALRGADAWLEPTTSF